MAWSCPPRIAPPTQVMVIPVAQHKEGVLEAATALLDRLKAMGLRAKMDASDQSMGWKAAEYEMKGIPPAGGDRPQGHGEEPVRPGPPGQWGEGLRLPDELETAVPATLDAIHDGLYQKAKKNLEEHIFQANSLEEAKALQAQHGASSRPCGAGDEACEIKMKEEGA